MRSTSVEISVIVPVWNEAKHLRKSLRTIADYARQATDSFEMIVVDDGSTDDTWSEIITAFTEIPQLEGIRLSRNFGKERALCAGLEQARGQAVIIIDGDLQHPPELIPEMIYQWQVNGAKIVEGVKKSRGEESKSYWLGTRLFYGLIRLLTRYNLSQASDFKLLDRQVVECWVRMRERNTFFRGMIAWLGFPTVTLEFDVAPRAEGQTNWRLAALAKLALNAVVSFTSWPLRLVTIGGMILFAVAIVLAIQTLYMKLAGVAEAGFSTVILLLLGMNSMIMLSIGIVGEYIAAIYNEVKGRPRYVINQKVSGRLPAIAGQEYSLNGLNVTTSRLTGNLRLRRKKLY